MWRPANILCLYSFEDDNQAILDRAIRLANNLQAKLTVATYQPLVSASTTALIQWDPDKVLTEEHQQALEKVVAPLKGQLDIDCKVICGPTYQDVIRKVLNDSHDLVIKTAEDEGISKRLFGSYDMELLRKCPCPVWLLKSGAKAESQRILAAIDVKDDYPTEEQATRRALNIQVLQTAYSLALAESAEIHVVSVWSAELENTMRSSPFVKASEDEIHHYIEGVRSSYQANYDSLLAEAVQWVGPDAETYLAPEIQLLKGEPKTLIPEYAEKNEVDLVVMGTVARTGIPGFTMGNTAETILGKLSQAVLAIKPEGFESPVKP